LDHQRAPKSVPPHRWRQFVNDCHQVVLGPEGWAERAASLDWDSASLFGCHPTRPLEHLGAAGLLWLVRGGRLVQLHKDGAVISANGVDLTYHRRPNYRNSVLPWRLR